MMECRSKICSFTIHRKNGMEYERGFHSSLEPYFTVYAWRRKEIFKIFLAQINFYVYFCSVIKIGIYEKKFINRIVRRRRKR